MKTIRTTVAIRSNVWSRFKRLCKTTGLRQSELLNVLLDEYLDDIESRVSKTSKVKLILDRTIRDLEQSIEDIGTAY